jgi:hypothetical protein
MVELQGANEVTCAGNLDVYTPQYSLKHEDSANRRYIARGLSKELAVVGLCLTPLSHYQRHKRPAEGCPYGGVYGGIGANSPTIKIAHGEFNDKLGVVVSFPYMDYITPKQGCQ